MNFASLFDPYAAALVLGGTLAATMLRCGLRDCGRTLRVLARLQRRRFNADRVRAELAQQIQEIRQDGLLRAYPHVFGDSEFEEATGAMIETRSIEAALALHERHKARRARGAGAAVQTLYQAAELAPVFGLAGTLVSLSQLPADGIGANAIAGAISMAVLTTLYGLLAANFLFAPLARAIERALEVEEEQRQKLFDWLVAQIAPAMPERKRPVGLVEVV